MRAAGSAPKVENWDVPLWNCRADSKRSRLVRTDLGSAGKVSHRSLRNLVFAPSVLLPSICADSIFYFDSNHIKRNQLIYFLDEIDFIHQSV